jgi:sec-independent protein translocase protein TatC
MAEDSDSETPSGGDDAVVDADPDETTSDESTTVGSDSIPPAEPGGDDPDATDADVDDAADTSARSGDAADGDTATAPADVDPETLTSRGDPLESGSDAEDESLLSDDDQSDDASFGADADADPVHDTAEDGGSAVDAPAVDDGFEDAAGFEETAEYEAADDDWGSGLVGEGPPEDQEMPLAAHIEEMVRRLGVVFLIGGVALLVTYPMAGDIINYLWNTHIPGAETIVDRRPRVYGPLEFILTKIKVAGLAGFVVGLPVFVYETYLFMRPGLYPRERRYYLAAVPTSLILALVGVAFAHFVVLPAIFAYFTSYTTGTALVAFGLKETFSLILILMGYMALVFQIPLFIMLAIMMNLVSRQWLEEKRLLFWGAFLGLAFFVSPDPTGMAPIIVGATMITLFEGTLALLRWTGN